MDLLLILMSKTYLFAIMLLFVPFTGCLETEESEPSLRESFDGLISSINADDLKSSVVIF